MLLYNPFAGQRLCEFDRPHSPNCAFSIMTLPLFTRLLFAFTLLGCAAASWAAPANTDLRILASLKPLALIAREVAGEQGIVDTLLPVAASPHDYPLKISDVQRLRAADVVLWVGPELETFLQRPLANLTDTRVVSTFALPGMQWPEHSDDAGHGHHHDHHHHHDKDPHLWLDPRNAAVIARALATTLAGLRPSLADYFHANAERFAADMRRLDLHLATQLQPVREQGFAVYHEGYLHFVGRYQLRQINYVTYSPERRPGARHLHRLRQSLAGQAVCLFTEPYYDARAAKNLSDELGLRIGVLDPIGGEHVESYSQLMEYLARDFLACLSQP